MISDPNNRRIMHDIKKWLKDFENYLNCGDYLNAHCMANKVAFWVKRLPDYEKEYKERMHV